MPLNGFSEDQIDHLENTLDPSVVANRKQGGSQVAYIQAWHAIAEANRIFGFDGWMRETVEMRLVQEGDTIIGKGKSYEKPGFKVSYVARVKVSVFAGDRTIVREGTGAGHGIDADVGQAHESATKEAESDAMKRALMMFGNPFGLALYDNSKANVKAPRESKANARGLFEALQSGIRQQENEGAIRTWWKSNIQDIRTLPSDWEEQLSEIGADMIARRNNHGMAA